jgi:hypothetical protein
MMAGQDRLDNGLRWGSSQAVAADGDVAVAHDVRARRALPWLVAARRLGQSCSEGSSLTRSARW